MIPKYKLYTNSKMLSHLNTPTFLKKLNKYNFVPHLISSFQDYDYLYLVTTFYEGRNMEAFINENLTEEKIKFVSACIIQALEYLRQENIIHRDISHTNIIMDEDRYFNLIDFSYSIDYHKKDDKEFYMQIFDMITPPEILENKVYDFNSDYYSLGSTIYYLMFKEFPLSKKIRENIPDIAIDYESMNNYSIDCIDFLNKLLISNYTERIGFNNINELKNHSWFKGFDWINLNKKKIKSPFTLIKSEIKQVKCSRLALLPEELSGFLITSKIKTYNELIGNFNFSNNYLIEKSMIFKSKFNNIKKIM